MRMTSDATDVLGGCEVLSWDSEFFGRRIGRVEPATLATAGTAAVDRWCASQEIECLYLLVDAADQTTSDLAQCAGYRLVDARLTLETAGPLPAVAAPDSGPSVRLAMPEDVTALTTIARECHRDSRFYADMHFDRQRCDDLYGLWIEKSCRGWADRVFVAEAGGTAVGYITCHLSPNEGRIGLVGVAVASRGLGVGRAMLREAHQWFARQGVARIAVVTQGRNSGGLRLYQRTGMAVRTVQFWFHKWF